MSSIATQISTINVPFHGQSLATIFHDGQPFVAMRPIIENIGIDWTGQLVKLKNQKEKFGCRDISTPTKGGIQKMICIPLRKLNGWLFSINPEKVRADIKDKLIQYQEECFSVLYEYWSKGEVKPKVSKTTVNERTPLRDAVNMLVGKKGLRYDDAYNMVHQRFNIDSIDELELNQIPLAVEYIHRVVLDGEYLGKQEAVPATVKQVQFTNDELCALSWLWLVADKMRRHAEETYPALKQLESKYAGDACDIAREFKYWLGNTESILSRETRHIAKPSGREGCYSSLAYLRENHWNPLPR
ncbi:hypothetical protein PL78_00265 [Yersinia entomophaga]|uniref:Antirepressor n=1 Tax=Yersinia entomophaga TaxID=935293 RepID=A0ABM6BFZ7_YERET|nr:phage antirepressor N-terminal domain-containing protein [Yersinia entomophaga]ANI28274.1 hypothetical protein PL78_00265 [Yersinia entomophaga]OWF84911.1 hypothetical protein B4914_18280 [Yersinia entomophaga]